MSSQATSPSPDVRFASTGSSAYGTVLALFCTVLVVSNIVAAKPIEIGSGSLALGPVQVWPLVIDGGAVLFPLAYVLGDVVSEVYGFRAARRAVMTGFAAALLVDSWQVSLALLLIPMAACTAYVAPALALVQNLTPPRSRATAAAVLMLMFNIVGLGLGPLFIGVVSDHLKPAYGDESLRWALLAILPFAVAAGLAQFAMTRHLDQDFAE